jgi:hypothetical protein
MDEPIIQLAQKLTDQLESFLKACQAEGDETIADVLNRLRELREES